MKSAFRKLFCVALFAAAAGTVQAADIKVYPNPWIPEDARGNRGDLTAAGAIKFDIPSSQEGELRIYTVTGSLVKRIDFAAAGARPVTWLGKNDDGDYVASGVYLWVVKTADSTKTGKVVVIR